MSCLVPGKCPFLGFLLSTFKLCWFHQGNKARMSSHRSKSNLKAGTLTNFSRRVSHLVLLKVSLSNLSSLPCRSWEFMLFFLEREERLLDSNADRPHTHFLESKGFPCLHFLCRVSVQSRPHTASSLLHSPLHFFQSYFLFLTLS